jgi:cell division protein FtsB
VRDVRRSRILLVGGLVVSAVVLGAWFPASALYHQHSNLATASTQLNQLRQEDVALAQEQKNLSGSAEVARIAREQYQLVSPGQQAYEVLPPSASQLPSGSIAASSHRTAARDGAAATQAALPQGIFKRILGALEFWR